MRREVSKFEDRRRTDIEVVDEKNGLVILIENKIHAVEHSNQLPHYRARIEREHSGYKKLFVYLTTEGDEPSDPDYISNYSQIAGLLDEICRHRANDISGDVAVAIRHYVQMPRRHLVTDGTLASLARAFYMKHRLALDYIFEQKPDPQLELKDELEDRLRKMPQLLLDESRKKFIRFLDKVWDQHPELKEGSGWTSSKRMLLLEIVNEQHKAQLILTLGPGPQQTRQRIYDAFRTDEDFS